MATLAIFAGSKGLPAEKQQQLNIFLGELFGSIAGRVDRIIYG